MGDRHSDHHVMRSNICGQPAYCPKDPLIDWHPSRHVLKPQSLPSKTDFTFFFSCSVCADFHPSRIFPFYRLFAFGDRLTFACFPPGLSRSRAPSFNCGSQHSQQRQSHPLSPRTSHPHGANRIPPPQAIFVGDQSVPGLAPPPSLTRKRYNSSPSAAFLRNFDSVPVCDGTATSRDSTSCGAFVRLSTTNAEYYTQRMSVPGTLSLLR